MKLTGNRLLRLVPQLTFPFAIHAPTGKSVGDFVDSQKDLADLIARGAVYAIGSPSALRQVRWVSDDARFGGGKLVRRESSPSRLIPSVDLIRSDAGSSSYVMRQVGADGELVMRECFRRAQAA